MNWKCFVLVFAMMSLAHSAAAQNPAKENSGFAVVELYTSEGCSSCPPADELLTKLTQWANSQQIPVYTLSFHVDYWDYLGWKDPFSREQFSQRQRQYAWVRQAESVYTPQMIINGGDGFSGYRDDLAKEAIERGLSQSSLVTLNVSLRDVSNDTITFQYNVPDVFTDLVLNVALVESELVSHVQRGENSNRTLSHSNVVRAFKSVPLTKSEGDLRLKLAPEMNPKNLSVVAYVQNPKTMRVIAAKKTAVVF